MITMTDPIAHQPIPQLEPRRILLLASNPPMRELLVAVFRCGGLDTSLASSGEDAVRLMQKAEASVLVIAPDHLASCEDLVRTLDRTVGLDTIRVLSLAVAGQARLKARLRELGVQAVVEEPFEPNQLVTVVENLLTTLNRQPLEAHG